MESKLLFIFVVFSVFATLGHSLDPQCTESYGLSKEQSAVLCKIKNAALVAETDQAESNLNPRGSVADLISIQQSATVFTAKITDGNKRVFDVVQLSLRKIALGFPVSGNNDVAEARTAADFIAGLRALVDSILYVDPDASTLVEKGWKFLVAGSEKISANFYDAIALAVSEDSTYTKALGKIKTLEKRNVEKIPDLIEAIVKLIRNGAEWDNAVAARIETLKNDATATAIGFSTRTFNAIKILLGAFYENPAVCTGDFLAVQIAQTQAASGINNVSEKIKAIRLIALAADNSK